jgi:2-succinyl-6-hydroxy-2,4-cyclohexadiene-1-carboxylate synthase
VAVFVAGFTQTAESWTPILDAAPDGVSRVDLARFPAPSTAPTFVDAAAALASGRRPYVGYSQGGRLCLQLALDRPDVVERLVLVSASPGIADDAARAARRDADEQLARGIEQDGVDAFLEHWIAQPLFATLAPERARLEDRRAANTVETLTYQLRVLGQGSQPSNWDRLGELDAPVLVIVGERDEKYVAIGHAMADAFRDAHVEVVAGAGHACHLERPEIVHQLLRSFGVFG